MKQRLAGLLVGLMLGGWLVASPAAQNFIWGSVNGVPAGPGIILTSNVPSPTTNALYNDGGTLKWNGSAVGGSSVWTQTGTVLSPTTAGDTISLPQGTITTAASNIESSVTWNAGGSTFKGWRLVVTDTASAAGSLPLEILGGAAGSTNLLKVAKTGEVVAGSFFRTGSTTSGFYNSDGTGIYPLSDGVLSVINNSANGFTSFRFGPATGNTARGTSAWGNGLVTIDMATATGSGTGTITSPTTAIPANSLVLGMTCKVTTILAGAGLTTFSIGDGTDPDRWGTGIAIAAGTTVNFGAATVTTPQAYAAATSIVLTAAAGVFSTGVLSCSPVIVSASPIGS